MHEPPQFAGYGDHRAELREALVSSTVPMSRLILRATVGSSFKVGGAQALAKPRRAGAGVGETRDLPQLHRPHRVVIG